MSESSIRRHQEFVTAEVVAAERGPQALDDIPRTLAAIKRITESSPGAELG